VLTLAAILLAVFVLPAPWGGIGIGVAVAVDVAETVVLFRWNTRRRAQVGIETLVGRTAITVGRLDRQGQVKLDGEIWDARIDGAVGVGVPVVVVGVDRLTLLVEHDGGT
jgi:membrane-bound ClpP family serine protease